MDCPLLGAGYAGRCNDNLILVLGAIYTNRYVVASACLCDGKGNKRQITTITTHSCPEKQGPIGYSIHIDTQNGPNFSGHRVNTPPSPKKVHDFPEGVVPLGSIVHTSNRSRRRSRFISQPAIVTMLLRCCAGPVYVLVVRIQPRKPVLHHADYARPPRDNKSYCR